MSPWEITLPVGGQTVFETSGFSCTSSLASYTWSVQEGVAGGTLLPFVQDGHKYATYVAPQTPGTYHVQVRYRFQDGMELVPVSTVTVTSSAAPQNAEDR